MSSLSNSKLIDAQTTSNQASAAIQTYVATVLQQADIELTEMPTLPTHQQLARKHATQWNTTILPGMIQTNADVIDFANQFTSYYSALMDLADKVATDDTSRKSFIEGLTFIRNNVSAKQRKVAEVESNLKVFKTNLDADYKVFQADAATATSIYTGKGGEISRLEGEIETTQNTLNAMIGLMAGGAVGIVAGAVMICVGAFAEIETAGLSTGLVVGGIGLLTGGITSEVVGGIKYGLAVEELGNLQAQLATDKQGLLAIKTVKGHLDGFVSQLSEATAGVADLVQQWTDLDSSLGKVIADVDKDPGTYGPLLKSMLSKANDDWTAALELAKKMQPTGQLSVKDYSKIQDAINTKG